VEADVKVTMPPRPLDETRRASHFFLCRDGAIRDDDVHDSARGPQELGRASRAISARGEKRFPETSPSFAMARKTSSATNFSGTMSAS
jgi:hypothetical protein